MQRQIVTFGNFVSLESFLFFELLYSCLICSSFILFILPDIFSFLISIVPLHLKDFDLFLFSFAYFLLLKPCYPFTS